MNLTSDWSLTDRTTWIALLSVVAAVLSDIFHRSFAGYVPAAATVAAGLVIAGAALGKHHLAAAFTTAVTTAQTAATELPAAPATSTTPAGPAAAPTTPVAATAPPAAPTAPTAPPAAP